MSWTNLPTDYADAVWEGERKYTINLGGGGTYQNSTITDETPYTPSTADGNYFYGANDANQTNDAINKIVAACGGDINSLKVEIANGGTGANTATGARTNLEVRKAHVLYSNSTGSSGTVTLSETCANFQYVEIYYRDDSNRYSSIECYEPNNKKIALTVVATTIASGGYSGTWMKSAEWKFSGATLALASSSEVGVTEFHNSDHPSSPLVKVYGTNHIYVCGVLGYKY